MAAVTVPLTDEALNDFIASACALVSRERNTPSAAHFVGKLAELGRALGFQARWSAATAASAEASWERDGRETHLFAVRDFAKVSLVLSVTPREHGKRTFLILTQPKAPDAATFEALRKVVPPSRPDLRAKDVTIVWAPSGGGGRVLRGDLVDDVVGRGRLIEVPGTAQRVGANPSRDAADFPLFPYGQVRDGQRALLRDVRVALEARKVLVAHAPTGIGKTAAVLAAAVEVARLRGKTVFFLTSRQTQHQIAVRTLREVEEVAGDRVRVVDLVSKQSMCPRPERPEHSGAFYEWCSHLCETKRCQYFLKPLDRAREQVLARILDVEESVKMSAKLGCCPHKVAVDAAKDAEVVVCDYNTLFDPGASTLDRIGRDPGDLIVVVDEAHNLADRIRDASGGRVTQGLISESYSELREREPELAFGVQELLKLFERLVAAAPERGEKRLVADDLEGPLIHVLSTRLVPKTYDQFVKELADASRKIVAAVEGRSATQEVAEFLRAWKQPDADTLRVVDTTDIPSVRITLLDPSVVAAPLFAAFHSAVLMSGTLYPMALTADLLGIPASRRMLESYPSPFLASRRPVLLLRGVSTRYKDRGEAMFGKIAAGVEAAARATPGNVAVFFPSYKLRDDIAAHLSTRVRAEVIVETREMTKGEKDRLASRLKRAKGKGGALLLAVMGGSFSEGVDFYDGILDAVVVVGLPLAPPSKEVDVLIDYFERKFGRGAGEVYAYLNPAITRVLQAAGRLIRREEDRGVVVLMDERLEQGRYQRLLPPDFAPRAVDDPDELRRVIQGFFDEGR